MVKFMSFSKSDNFYVKIMFYLTLAISLTILIVSVILYLNFENIGLSLLYSFSKDSLSQVSYSATFMDDTIKSLATQIYLNNDTSKLLYMPELDSFDLTSGLNRISSYKSSMSIIYSIYLYNKKSNTYYTNLQSVAIQDKDIFFDREIVSILDNFPPEKRLKPIARKLIEPTSINGQSPYSNVYSYIFYDYPSKDNQLENAVVINVSEEWMRKTINAMDTLPGSSTIIIDEKGRIVCGNKQGTMATDISNKEYISNIIKLSSSSGYFVKNVDGAKSLITYVSSENSGWIFVRITPYSLVINQINNMRYITILICIIILAVGLLLSYIASRMISKPFDDILTKLKDMNLTEKSNALVRKQDFLTSLVKSANTYEEEYIIGNFSKHQVKISPKQELYLIILKIDAFSVFCSKYNLNDRILMKSGIINIALELADGKLVCEALDMGEENLIIIMNSPVQAQTEFHDMLQCYANEIQECVKKYLDISLSITLSAVEYCEIDELHNLYTSLLNTSMQRLYYGHKTIIFAEELNLPDPDSYSYPFQKEEALLEALNLGQLEKVKSLYSQIIDSVNRYPVSVFNSTTLRLISAVNIAVDKIEKGSAIKFSFNFSNFIAEISKQETLAEINNSFFNMFDFIFLKLAERKDEKHDALINKVIKTINLNYQDPLLSLDYIADIVNMSPIYLGKLFKKATSKSVANYINDLRLEGARNLLAESSVSISKIAEKIGFSNINYFCILFKKTYGVTPSEYRKSL